MNMNSNLAVVITPLCLSFSYEFSSVIYTPTASELNELTFGENGKFWGPTIFTVINYVLQIYTTPIWTKIAQRRRFNAILAALMATILPNMAVLFAIGVNSEDTVMIYKVYLVMSALSGVFGLPIALAFAIAKFDRHLYKQNTYKDEGKEREGNTDNCVQQQDPLFIVMLSVPAAVLAGLAASSDTPRIGYAAVWSLCAIILSSIIIVMDNHCNYNKKQALAKVDTENQKHIHQQQLSESGGLPVAAGYGEETRQNTDNGSDDVTRSSVAEIAQDMSSRPIFLKYISNSRFMAFAVPLALLQFGHEASFNDTGTNIFGLLDPKLGPIETKAFIGRLFRTGALCNMVSLLFLPWIIHQFCKFGDIGTAATGITSAAISYLIYGIAKTESGLWVAELSGFCVLLAKPALVAALIATAGTSISDVGEMTGAMFSIGHFGSITGLILGAVMFTDIGQNSYYVLMTAPLLGLCCLAWSKMEDKK